MKKILSLILAGTLALSALTVFADKTASDEASHLIEKGYIQGTENGYELDREATNAEALTLLYRIADLEATITPESDHWADGIIADAKTNGFLGESYPQTAAFYGTIDTTGEQALLNEDEYLLNTQETLVFIGSDFFPYSEVKDQINGKEVWAVVSNFITMSIPAQTNAHYILVATETENPIYMEISEVSNEDGTIKVSSADGNYIASLDAMADLNPLMTRNIIKACDLKAGDKILVYSNMMTMSIPALLNPEKVIVLSQVAEFAPESSITAEALEILAARILPEKVDAAAPALEGIEIVTRDVLAKFCFNLLK